MPDAGCRWPQVRSVRPCALRASTTALTSWARARVVTSSASGVSTTTTSSSPTTATRRPPAGHDHSAGVDHRHVVRLAEHAQVGAGSALREQRREAREVARRRPTRRGPGRRRRARHPPRARRRRGRSRSWSAPATPRRRRDGSAAMARSPGRQLGVPLLEQVEQHRGPDDEHACVPAEVARRDVLRRAHGIRLLDELHGVQRGRRSGQAPPPRGCSRSRSRGGSARCRSSRGARRGRPSAASRITASKAAVSGMTWSAANEPITASGSSALDDGGGQPDGGHRVARRRLGQHLLGAEARQLARARHPRVRHRSRRRPGRRSAARAGRRWPGGASGRCR